MQDKNDIESTIKELDSEKDKNQILKQTVLQLDGELNEIYKNVSPRKIAMDYQ